MSCYGNERGEKNAVYFTEAEFDVLMLVQEEYKPFVLKIALQLHR